MQHAVVKISYIAARFVVFWQGQARRHFEQVCVLVCFAAPIVTDLVITTLPDPKYDIEFRIASELLGRTNEDRAIDYVFQVMRDSAHRAMKVSRQINDHSCECFQFQESPNIAGERMALHMCFKNQVIDSYWVSQVHDLQRHRSEYSFKLGSCRVGISQADFDNGVPVDPGSGVAACSSRWLE